MSNSWWLDELAHAGPEHLDPDFVAGYDRKQGDPGVDADLDVLRELGALTESSTVVDLAAGTGRFAIAAADRCRRVVAVDVSAAMIDHVRRRAAETGVANLECVQAGFLSYRHGGAPADAVFCRNALHQLPDFWKGVALHRVHRILRPGGVLRLRDLVYDCRPAEVEAVVERWLEGAVADPAAGYTREDFATHVRTEFSTYRWLLEPLLDAAGFTIVDSTIVRDVYATYTCVRRSS